ncbi:hypothetical protein, partial [Xanthovirga aplysinae]|uniref:hypothetical protein n=1 Tax=Xanthovirga aplysinae TaxID=2529853 RepID=UPI0016575584
INASLTVSGTANLASINSSGTIQENGARVLSTNYLGGPSSGRDFDLNTLTGIRSNYGGPQHMLNRPVDSYGLAVNFDSYSESLKSQLYF